MGHLGRRIGKHKNNPIQRNLADEWGPNCRQIATLLQIPAAFSPKETPQCSQASALLHSNRSKKHTNSIWEYKSSTSLVISFIAKCARIHIAFPAQILMKEHPQLPLPRGKTAHTKSPAAQGVEYGYVKDYSDTRTFCQFKDLVQFQSSWSQKPKITQFFSFPMFHSLEPVWCLG